MHAKQIKEALLKSLKVSPSINIKATILHLGAFVGKPFYNTLLKKIDLKKT